MVRLNLKHACFTIVVLSSLYCTVFKRSRASPCERVDNFNNYNLGLEHVQISSSC